MYNFAKENNLLICAGSDYHGSEEHKYFDVEFLSKNMETDIKRWIDEVKGKVTIN